MSDEMSDEPTNDMSDTRCPDCQAPWYPICGVDERHVQAGEDCLRRQLARLRERVEKAEHDLGQAEIVVNIGRERAERAEVACVTLRAILADIAAKRRAYIRAYTAWEQALGPGDVPKYQESYHHILITMEETHRTLLDATKAAAVKENPWRENLISPDFPGDVLGPKPHNGEGRS